MNRFLKINIQLRILFITVVIIIGLVLVLIAKLNNQQEQIIILNNSTIKQNKTDTLNKIFLHGNYNI